MLITSILEKTDQNLTIALERLFAYELCIITQDRVWKDDKDPLRISAVVHFYIYMYEFKKLVNTSC